MKRSRSSETGRGGRWHPTGVLLTGATAAALTIGAVSVGAFDTLQVSLFDNTSTAEGSHVPTPIITVDGTAFELVYTADGEIGGNGPQEWTVSNTGDADGVWDGAFVRDAEVDDAVAAATRVEVTLIIDYYRLGTWYQAAVDLDLGTLADPLLLTEAHAAWVDEARDELHPTTAANGAINGSSLRRSIPFPGTLTHNFRGDGVGRPSYSLIVRPSFDEEAIAEVSRSVNLGTATTATATFEVTYAKG